MRCFDSIAGEWNEYRKNPSPILFHFLKQAPEEGIFLDLGCGNARNLVEIAKKSRHSIGVDSSKQMLSNALTNLRQKNLLNKTRLIKASITSLPFENNYFDSIFCLAVLHHLRTDSQRLNALREANRVLKARGLAFFTVWNGLQKKFDSLSSKNALIKWRTKDGREVRRFYHFFSEEEIRFLARKTGFEVRELFFEKNGEKTSSREGKNLCFTLFKPF